MEQNLVDARAGSLPSNRLPDYAIAPEILGSDRLLHHLLRGGSLQPPLANRTHLASRLPLLLKLLLLLLLMLLLLLLLFLLLLLLCTSHHPILAYRRHLS